MHVGPVSGCVPPLHLVACITSRVVPASLQFQVLALVVVTHFDVVLEVVVGAVFLHDVFSCGGLL